MLEKVFWMMTPKSLDSCLLGMYNLIFFFNLALVFVLYVGSFDYAKTAGQWLALIDRLMEEISTQGRSTSFYRPRGLRFVEY